MARVFRIDAFPHLMLRTSEFSGAAFARFIIISSTRAGVTQGKFVENDVMNHEGKVKAFPSALQA